ncbi:MAG TPA: thermonuclease family protein [Xanthobacteraceae bacterium]|nr:thermonuclease family protein [Xanthobacteraceae bacterium]
MAHAIRQRHLPQYRRIPAFRSRPMSGWDGVAAGLLAAGLTLFSGCSGAAAQDRLQDRPSPVSACTGTTLAHGTVSRVIDGRTFVLGDGREIRLAAIEVPPLAPADDAKAVPGGDAAKNALAGLLAGGDIVIKQADAQTTDRYGRLVGYAFVSRAGADHAVQADLLAAGFARVAARAGSRACTLELLNRERAARAAKLGLWASSYYESLNADDPAKVLAEQGHFAVVEGKVVSVRESGATIYVNFGRRWSTDFTVTILKRNARSFTTAGLEPKTLAGRRVRVRGWIEERGGPWIEATRPEQIELIDRE